MRRTPTSTTRSMGWTSAGSAPSPRRRRWRCSGAAPIPRRSSSAWRQAVRSGRARSRPRASASRCGSPGRTDDEDPGIGRGLTFLLWRKSSPSTRPNATSRRLLNRAPRCRARRLHWDFRLEKDGVGVSWAVPKGIPPDPKKNHLAVHVEDHPLEYFKFAGEIPKGEYGGGQVLIWDEGTYEPIKWSDREVMVELHGKRLQGRYVLFRTRGEDWMIHRMDPPQDPERKPMPGRIEPMMAKLATKVPTPDRSEERRVG